MAIDPVSAARAYQASRARRTSRRRDKRRRRRLRRASCRKPIRQAGQSANVAEHSALRLLADNADIVDVVTAIAAAETQLKP